MQNNTSEAAPKRERTAIYTLARIIFGFLFHTIFPLRFHNAQIVEEMQPPYIIMANHRSFADPMALAIKVKRYEIRFIGKRELAHGRLKSWLFSGLHMILVSRHATDMAAMRQCMQTLKEGHILGIFPEGTRHQPEMMQEVESGTAIIALRARVPLLPVYIDGKIRPFHITHIYYGKPMELDDLYAQGVNNDTAHQLCQRIHDVFYAMRDEVHASK
ncbi:MAG: lysophospholipid acyltransferase family protein [Clostridiales bacterium]|nr:1-acyl-sn-glycerol-3-phosphate acyltransferase [Eubacteriales bacterium]MCI5766616.1 1-acyl-sn-glycerol-3-phosphate acyltransferase [Clostridiales bacterium]MDD7121307.1 lysophospholipid acyltransferase family protein [Clostridiales bacterium]MDY5469013.1 lysophospholipid acyltransferase family protein [Eubacteriales bacterium]